MLLNSKSNSSGSKNVIFIFIIAFFSICFAQFFYMSVYANNLSFNENANYDPDPYYGTKEYWDETYPGTKQYLTQEELSPGTTITSGDYFINSDIVVDGKSNLSKSGLVIDGNVNIYFEDNGSLTVYGGNSNSTDSAGAGIEVTQGNSFYCQGKGSLNAFGGNVNVNVNAVQGKDGVRGNDSKAGNGGNGGDGSSGSGAAIGTKGGKGGTGGISPEGPRVSEGDYVAGKNGSNGSDGSRASIAGEIYFSGNVKVNCKYGNLIFDSSKFKESKGHTPYEHSPDIVVSSGGGGANGGIGFFGANIGSGGSGASGGGAGGTGGIFKEESGNDVFDYSTAGGGGGAGLGRYKPVYGGGVDGTTHTNKPEKGVSFDNSSPSYEVKSGGKGAWRVHEHTDYCGGAGGNGGIISNQPTSNKLITSVDINRESLADRMTYDGVENEEYNIYPEYECDLVLTDSIDKDGSATYTGKEIKPKFDIVHKPTGKVLHFDDSSYHTLYTDNIERGIATIVFYGNPSLEKGKDVLGKDIKTPGGVIVKEFLIKEHLNLINENFDKEYDGNPYEVSLEGAKIVTEGGIDMTHYFGLDDINYEFYKVVDGKDVLFYGSPIEPGEYKIRYFSTKGCWDIYKCETYYTINITPRHIDFSIEGDILTVSKLYDGTSDYSESTKISQISYDGILDKDKGNINIKLATNTAGDFNFPIVEPGSSQASIYFIIEGDYAYKYYFESNRTTANFIISSTTLHYEGAHAQSKIYDGTDEVKVIDAVFTDTVYHVPVELNFGTDIVFTSEIWHADGIDHGIHNVTFELKLNNTNYAFEDAEGNDPWIKQFSTTVVFAYSTLDPPKPSNKKYVYTGIEQEYDVGSFDGHYEVSDNKATNSGKYQVKYTLTNYNYIWRGVEDGYETEPYFLTWEIEKAAAPEGVGDQIIYKPNSTYGLQNDNIVFPGLQDDMIDGLSYKIKSLDGDLNIVSSDVSLDNQSGILYYFLNGLSQAGNKFNVNTIISCRNYVSFEKKITVQIIDKMEVEISGLTVEGKAYDGTAVSPSGKLKLVDKITGEDITDKFGPGDIEYNYYVKDGQKLGQAPKDAGIYSFEIKISEDQAYYAGSSKQDFTIEKATIIVTENDYSVVKTYDKNKSIDSADILGELNFSGIIDADKSKIECGATLQDYPSVDVSIKEVQLSLYKKDKNNSVSDNYEFNTDTITATYIINPALVILKNYSFVDRDFKEGDTSIETDNLVFEGIIGGDSFVEDEDYFVSADITDPTCTEGNHNVKGKITLKDGSNYTFDQTPKYFEGKVNIYLRVVQPKASLTQYFYNEDLQEYDVPATDKYSVEGNHQKNAGEYDVIYKLNSLYYKWSDVEASKEFDPCVLKWVINKANAPAIDPCVVTRLKSQTGQQIDAVKFEQIPEGMKVGLNMTAGAATGDLNILVGDPVFNFNEMTISYNLSGSGKEGNSVSVPISITSDNYTNTNSFIVIKLAAKVIVDFYNISFSKKTYDGNAIYPEGTLVVKDHETGAVITDLDQNNIVYTYSKQGGTILDDAPADAGNYCYTISVSDKDEKYAGSTDIKFDISPKTITVTNNNYTLTKTYDKTLSYEPAIVSGSVEFDGVIEPEIDKIICGVTPQDYTNVNVSKEVKPIGLYKKGIDGAIAENYVFDVNTIDATYIVAQKYINVYPNTLNVTKVFDGTKILGTVTGNISYDGVLEGDLANVSVSITKMEPYPSENVNNYIVQNYPQIVGDINGNYALASKSIDVPYNITPKLLSITSATFKNRAYEWENYTIDVDNVVFEGSIVGFPPNYNVEAVVEDNEVAENIPFNFTISLVGPENYDNINLSNYVFEGGQYSYEGNSNVNIYKHDGIQVALYETETYENDFGLKIHQLNLDNLPGGMVSGIEFLKDQIVEDDNRLINDWDVNGSSGLITYDLANKDNIEAKAVVKINIDSKNYYQSSAFLEINVNNIIEPEYINGSDSYDGAAATFDKISEIVSLIICLLFAITIVTLFLPSKKRKLYR